MLTLGLISQKGGAGKTTLAIHLARKAQLSGLAVQLIDLDPQASAQHWYDRAAPHRRRNSTPAVRLGNPERPDLALAGALGNDLVILDTAPHSSAVSYRAAKACNLVLVPVRPAILDLDAIGTTLDICAAAKVPSLVVINAAPVQGSRIVADARAAIVNIGGKPAHAVICQRVAYSRSLMTGRTAFDVPTRHPQREISALYHEILRHLAPKKEYAHAQAQPR